ncbi:ATP-binding cassette domain-containing protein [Campylobacter lari]|uniref:ATP-binding cassette domain-containing protein n=1 Tax=Campylobacter lari TaxID=201 RepID=UPI000E1258AE|nr:ATP-binding cassette domain-containing protein [Campylobacter lari]SUX05741.1 Excinuclease ABC subunit A [Campylobacter lari]
MILKGIKTHNLKNLDFKALDPEIIGVYGVSGGGKSSFAYHTLYALCKDTFEALENGHIENGQYIVQYYEKLIPSIAIKQLNLNTNPRSNIYSYANFSSLLSTLNMLDYNLLKLNKPTNECFHCHGQGSTNTINKDLIINNTQKICDMPFIPWKPKEYGNNSMEILLLEFCKQHKIDINKSFQELSPHIQDILLYAKEEYKFKINYKHNKKPRIRHISYTGIMTYIENLLQSDKKSEYAKAKKYCTNILCPICKGSKINTEKYKNIFLWERSFQDFLTQPFDIIKQDFKNKTIQSQRIYDILQSYCDLGIGYLSLNRSIPSLSGGELQKLKLANLIHTNMSNLFIVIDEISSGLHISDFDKVLQLIQKLKDRGNIIVLIEHNQYLLEKCDRLINIGPVGGKDGGYIIDSTFKKIPFTCTNKATKLNDFLHIKNININNIINQNIKIPISAITAFIGRSGSGKSSLAKYLSDTQEKCIYISQKTLRGNIKSSVVTYLELSKEISKYFAKHFHKEDGYFTSNGGSDIICSQCNGTGTIRYERGFELSLDIICTQCEGKMFNDKAQNFKINGLSVIDIYDCELALLNNSFIPKLRKLSEFACKLSLGHLSLNRKINTLSGGEIKRIKLLKEVLANLKDKILIVDEPSAGLDLDNANKALRLLQQTQTLATIIIEHNPHIFLQADYIVEIGPYSGTLGGKIIFNDSAKKYYANHDDFLSQYL